MQVENDILRSLFTGFLVHIILPDSILSVILVPIIKDRTGKINSMDNYGPIALASPLFKVIERISLNKMEHFVLTSDNQFGFKPKHGTDMCIFALKEILDFYNRHNSSICCMCFIDASNCVNHEKYFFKSYNRGVPKFVVRILAFWYAHQLMYVKFGNCVCSIHRM